MFFSFLPLVAAISIGGCAQKTAYVAQQPATPPTQATQDVSSTLIKSGAAMPDLTLTAVDGKPMKLADELKGHKALLLNFWFYT